jgi:hypothetical protein
MDEPSLLRSLTARAAGHELAGTPPGKGWLRVAHVLDRITTGIRLCLSPDAEESSGVALRTGRLVYTDLGWALGSGPARRP